MARAYISQSYQWVSARTGTRCGAVSDCAHAWLCLTVSLSCGIRALPSLSLYTLAPMPCGTRVPPCLVIHAHFTGTAENSAFYGGAWAFHYPANAAQSDSHNMHYGKLIQDYLMMPRNLSRGVPEYRFEGVDGGVMDAYPGDLMAVVVWGYGGEYAMSLSGCLAGVIVSGCVQLCLLGSCLVRGRSCAM